MVVKILECGMGCSQKFGFENWAPEKFLGKLYMGFYMSEVFIFGAPGGENAHTGLSCGRRSIIGEIWHF